MYPIDFSKEDSYVTKLANLMSNISEDCYAAGWLHDNEYALWAMMTKKIRPIYGLSELYKEILELWDYHNAAGGWIFWDSKTCQETFVTTEEWLPMFDEWAKDKDLRYLNEVELEQLDAEMRASWTAGVFDFEAREKAVEKLRAEKGWTRIPDYYMP